VILVGVPYPAAKDVKIVAKMKYLDSIEQKNRKGMLSGNQWYLSETIRSINQGIGRIIRNKKDYGSIYLLD
jgi:regulator of telomere elongation helicase 1